MRSHIQQSRARSGSRSHRLGILTAAAGLFLGTVATAAPSIADQPIAPTSIVVTVDTFTDTDTGGVVPVVLAEVDNGSTTDMLDEMTVRVVLQPEGATFNSDTPVTFEATGLGTGVFSPSKAVFPKDVSKWDFPHVTYSKVENGITLTATAGRGNKALSAESNTFDIQYSVLKQGPRSDPFTLGGDECSAASNTSICAIVLLPNGLTTNLGAALAVGACTTYYPDCSSPTGRIVSFMADLTADYTHADPATIIMRCDKTFCKGGGVGSYTIQATVPWDDLTFDPVPACSTKGQVQAGVNHCVDYVQSHRDNAGDLLLYWLVAKDLRGTM